MLWTALLMGLAGSFHCAGMCGPIALALSSANNNQLQATGKLIYNLGRIITYTLLGAVFGLVGEGMALIGFQQYVSIFSGVLILLFLFLSKLTSLETSFSVVLNKGVARIKKVLSKYFLKQGVFSRFWVGLLNGLLPCGLVYLALIASISQEDLLASATYMFVFGAGTIPMMLLIMLGGNLITAKYRIWINKATPYLAVFIAVLFILRGLNLGVPYLSPEFHQENNEVKSSCCEHHQ